MEGELFYKYIIQQLLRKKSDQWFLSLPWTIKTRFHQHGCFVFIKSLCYQRAEIDNIYLQVSCL